MKKISIICVILGTLFLAGCETTKNAVLETDGETQLQIRNYQSRSFDTGDKERVLRATIATLQDFGFIIERADFMLGTVTASKVKHYQPVKITVSTRQKGKDKIMVRANGQYGTDPIKDPKIYQDFFTSLEKSLFLSANSAD